MPDKIQKFGPIYMIFKSFFDFWYFLLISFFKRCISNPVRGECGTFPFIIGKNMALYENIFIGRQDLSQQQIEALGVGLGLYILKTAEQSFAVNIAG